MNEQQLVRVGARVQTKSGRKGLVLGMRGHGDTAAVEWDDGEEFTIKIVHLTVIEDERRKG